MNPMSIEVTQQTCRLFVPAETVPDDEQRALEMAAQLLAQRYRHHFQ
jgi:hypothetical protein